MAENRKDRRPDDQNRSHVDDANTRSGNSQPRGKGRRNRKKGNKPGNNVPSGKDNSSPPEYGSRENATNDISWYSKYPSLLTGAASIPFPNKPGRFVTLNGGDNAVTVPIPGVCSIAWAPSVGFAEDPTDPINITCHEIFGKVRAAFSSELAVDAPDFGIYFICLSSIFSYTAALKRVFRTLNAFNPSNYAVPNALLMQQGLSLASVEALRADKMALFNAINELIAMTRKFLCPAIMPMFNRQYWLNDNIYTDAETTSAQLYQFVQTKYFKFALLNTPDGVPAGGAQVIAAPFYVGGAANVTVSDLYKFGTALINALSTWDSSYTISGYLRRAYEGEPSFTVEDLAYSETLELQYDEVVLSQIENCFVPSGVVVPNITQNPKTNSLIFKVTKTVNPSSLEAAQIAPATVLNCRADMPTAADVTEASRLHCTWMVRSSTSTDVNVIALTGSEIPLLVMYAYPNRTATGAVSWLTASVDSFLLLNNFDEFFDAESIILSMAIISQFDWHPISLVQQVFGSENAQTLGDTWYVFGDTRNIASLSQEQLAQINKICLFSEFNAFSE